MSHSLHDVSYYICSNWASSLRAGSLPLEKELLVQEQYGQLIPLYELGRFSCPAKGRGGLMDIEDYCNF